MKTGIIVTVVVLLSIIGLGFFQYQQLEGGSVTGESISALSTAFSASISDADADISQVNQLLSVLDQVSVLSQLDTGLFNTPKYAGLKDFSVTLFPAQNVGRKNPFLGIDESVAQPISSNTKKSTSTTGSAQQGNTSNSSFAGIENSYSSQQNFGVSSGNANPNADQQNYNNTTQPSNGTTSSGTQSSLCDPFTNPSCLDDPDALNAFLQSYGGTDPASGDPTNP